MKRLFEMNGTFFSSKGEAKIARGDPTKKAVPRDPTVLGSKAVPPEYAHEIHLGPDHWKRGGAVPA